MMMRTNRRAEDFDRALSGDAAAVDPSTAALVALAGALAAVPQRPAPAFRESLRAQLMSEAVKVAAGGAAVSATAAASVPAATAVAPLKGLPNLLAKPAMQALTGGLATAVAVAGVGVGASRSLPGDTLYGLKRAVERLQNGLAGGTVAEADAVIEHARTRVDEIVALLDRDGLNAVDEVEGALADLKSDLDDATADLLAQARAGSRAAYDKLDATVRDFTAELSALRASLPPEAQDELAAAMATLNSTAALLGALPVPGGPTPTHSPTSVPTTTPPTTAPPSSPTKTPSKTPSSEPTGVVPTIRTPTVTPPPTTLPPLPTITIPPIDLG